MSAAAVFWFQVLATFVSGCEHPTTNSTPVSIVRRHIPCKTLFMDIVSSPLNVPGRPRRLERRRLSQTISSSAAISLAERDLWNKAAGRARAGCRRLDARVFWEGFRNLPFQLLPQPRLTRG